MYVCFAVLLSWKQRSWDREKIKSRLGREERPVVEGVGGNGKHDPNIF